jgi:hypothetical protein
MIIKKRPIFLIIFLILTFSNLVQGQVLNKQKMLDKFHFWHNKDWTWYKKNIPFFESPDSAIDETYYYRWELMTAHLVYGSPETGYASTEFIDRPWWSGKYGAISCAAGHQLYEFRWFKNKRFEEDYARYWFRTPGAQPRNYSTWIEDAIWQGYKVNLDKNFVLDLEKDLVKDYEGWEQEHWVESEGMFAWDGMHDGMETNINSRQTKDWFAGASGYRPTLNSYMWANALAIKKIAALGRDTATANLYAQKANIIKSNFLKKNWDPKRLFFFHRYQNDEQGGIKANTLTYQTGKYAGNPHGREEIGFIPWYFNMPDAGFESAWQYAIDSNYFFAPYGPTTVEKGDPQFLIAKNCCAWSGNAWPYATSQTLKAMANVIKYYKQDYVNKEDYFKQLKIFAITQRKNGEPYIAEADNPETGSWSGHDVIGHSENYFHSSFIDEIITGLVGLDPKATDSIEVNPLIPGSWDYFALDDISYHGHLVSIIWDRNGNRYHKGIGLMILSDGKIIASSPVIKKLVAYIDFKRQPEIDLPVNYAVNNESEQYFPRAISSFPGIGSDMNSKLNDGQYWYYTSTTNRWSSLYSKSKKEWCGIDFGAPRSINTVKVYFVEDTAIKAPASYELEYWDGSWKKVENCKRSLIKPEASRANVLSFKELNTSKLRIVMIPEKGFAVAVSEFEAWGPRKSVLKKNDQFETENRAYKTNADVSASFTSKFDNLNFINDGLADPTFRWTDFESPSKSDWVQFDFKKTNKINTAYLYFYSDKGGVQPPQDYQVQYWNGQIWKEVKSLIKTPLQPIANLNVCSFTEVETTKIRFVFIHKSEKVFSGLYEVELYDK